MNEHDHWTSQLELYLDGMLTGEALHAFKRRLNEDEQMQVALKQQRRINLALRQRLAPSQQLATHEWFSKMELNGHAPADAVSSRTMHQPHDPATTPAVRMKFPRWWYAMAAALLLTAIGGWLAWTFVISGGGQPTRVITEVPRLSFDRYYKRKINDGFKPAWVCGDDEEFKSSFRDRFGQAMLIAPLPENVSMAGLDYNNCLSSQTLSVVMRVNGEGVVVIVDNVKNDKGAPTLPDPLNVYRRELGALILYEVTPLDQPATLDFFYDPDAAKPPPSDPSPSQ